MCHNISFHGASGPEKDETYGYLFYVHDEDASDICVVHVCVPFWEEYVHKRLVVSRTPSKEEMRPKVVVVNRSSADRHLVAALESAQPPAQ